MARRPSNHLTTPLSSRMSPIPKRMSGWTLISLLTIDVIFRAARVLFEPQTVLQLFFPPASTTVGSSRQPGHTLSAAPLKQ